MPDSAQTAWPLVVGFMRRRCGLVLEDDQRYLLGSRLESVADRMGYGSILEFVAQATAPDAAPTAVAELIDAMTTHETSFFRDAGFWTWLAKVIVPGLRDIARLRRPRVWSAACSTGQEPYSLAMVLAETDEALASAVDIVATDVSELALARARRGVYTALEVNRGLGAARVAAHTVPVGDGSVVLAPYLRERVTFEPHNLLAGPGPAGAFDIVLCRNVLFYFDAADRRRALASLQRSAARGGWIGVGSTESFGDQTPVSPGWYRNVLGAGGV